MDIKPYGNAIRETMQRILDDMIKETGEELSGKEAVVIGRSNIVGKPMAMLLLRENCTVTLCHSRTKNLAEHTRRADILVAAVGKETWILTL